ncbi:MAG: LytTR family DNA-binding domain-containing protein [Kofleriaceae bacterium]|nr:LytTR family DNA-binding domain-containing protein [Kofleriaceae bacterium]
MRAIVVDDEPPARRRLLRLLDVEPDVDVVAEAGDSAALLALLPTARADVVFLDIRMPGLDGVTLARRASLPFVVFTTAYADHAVDAFEVYAIDYLVKPIRAERLTQALDRVRVAMGAKTSAIGAAARSSPKVAAIVLGETRLFDAREITRFWSADKYTVFVLDGEEHETVESLASLEERLGESGFVRTHRSELVNVAAVRAMRRDETGLVLELVDRQEVQVSRRHAAAVRARIRS